MIGRAVGRYRITRFIGEGGMAHVFEGEHQDPNMSRQVAVKVLLREYCNHPEVVNRFLNEARALGKISHPGVVDVFDIVQLPSGRVSLIMELLQGMTLRDHLAQRGPMNTTQALPVMIQLADTIAAAHDQRIIHRDVKPENIFITHDTLGGIRTKLLDFGIAKLLEGAGNVQTATKSTLGTAAYMPPEQFKSAKLVDHRSDVYALGCVFFEMLGGRPPFMGRTLVDHMRAHMSEPPPPIRSLVPTVPAELDAIITRMLAKDPNERFGSMHELRIALEALNGPQPVGPMSATMPAATAEPSGGGNAWLIIALVLVAAVIGGIVAVALM
jgi:serine/threonine-protein kinase